MPYIIVILLIALIVSLLIFKTPKKRKGYPELLVSGLPTVLDFYTDTCPVCQEMDPILNDLAKEFSGKVGIRKINANEEPELSNEFEIQFVPTYILLDSTGEVVEKMVGGNPDGLRGLFEKALKI